MTKRTDAKAATKAKVLAAATKLFTERGFELANIRAIAATAGVSTGAVFASFDSKEDLWREAMGLPTPEEVMKAYPDMLAALMTARGALRNAQARLQPGAAIANVGHALDAVNAALPTRQREGASA